MKKIIPFEKIKETYNAYKNLASLYFDEPDIDSKKIRLVKDYVLSLNKEDFNKLKMKYNINTISDLLNDSSNSCNKNYSITDVLKVENKLMKYLDNKVNKQKQDFFI
jgi:hypothetical protein